MNELKKIQKLPADPILHLSTLYRADTRADKIDVGVGVFRDSTGNTPIMRAVKAAEKYIYQHEDSKTYVSIAGNALFNTGMKQLILADAVSADRLAIVQAPGGSGAIRIMADFLYQTNPNTVIHLSDPTWGNHLPIFQAAGLKTATYAYLDKSTKQVDEDKMLQSLETLGEQDVLLLHGCCHNPTGSDISLAAWKQIADAANQQGFLVFVDFAYQGFGDGLDEDAAGVRALASLTNNLIITASCSKNFGLYRERVGAALFVGETPAQTEAVQSHMNAANRVAYSMPPDHGAAIAGHILNDSSLRADWQTELAEMRGRIHGLRKQLAEAFAQNSQTSNWDFIVKHRGMFTLLCLSGAACEHLVQKESIYLVNGGRINIAGLQTDAQIERFAKAVIAVANQ